MRCLGKPGRFTNAFLAFDLAAVRDLVALLEQEDGHTNQRHEICATAIREMLSGISIEQRFGRLLLDVAELKQRFVDGYALFAASFSFEKIRYQAEAIRIEYTGKIHKTLSDIQGQLLGIPVSTIVVATQFKDVASTQAAHGQQWINLGVIIGAFVFCVLFSFSAWNQWLTLSVLEEEIQRHEKSLLAESSALKSRLDGVFGKLRDRVTSHRFILGAVTVICVVGFLVSLIVFWFLTGYAFLKTPLPN